MRSYALTLLAVTLRLWKLGLVLMFHPNPMDVYRVVAGLGFVPNLLLAEWLIRRVSQQFLTDCLFGNGDFDQICTIAGNQQGDPMRAACADLTVTSLPSGHWLPLERKAELIQAICTWLGTKNLL